MTDWPNLKTSSRAFNSTQIVGNLDEALAFYKGVLGLKAYLKARGASDAPGEHVLGLSREAMTRVVREVYIVNPSGEKNDGSIELVEFEDYSGRDFSEHGRPPNLGNLMVRYVVEDLDGLIAHLTDQGVKLEHQPAQHILAPYGAVSSIAIRSPECAWIEFLELEEAR